MDDISIWDGAFTLFVLMFLVIYFVAIIHILHRLGYSGWWSILSVIPFVNAVGLLALAYARWPNGEALNAPMPVHMRPIAKPSNP